MNPAQVLGAQPGWSRKNSCRVATTYGGGSESGGGMTVKELRDKLAGIADQTKVVAYREEGTEQQFFEIDEVSLTRGTPKRVKGKPGFEFDSKGLVDWVFINVTSDF
jgi:hypothetical protein